MTLNELLKILQIKSLDINPEIVRLQLDSRLIQSGDLFIALPGQFHDGRKFIDSALQQGAAAVLYEPENFPPHTAKLAIAIPQLNTKLGLLAAHFYDDPSARLQVFAVTGTNGKTSTCHLLSYALRKLNTPTAVIGTLGIGTDHWQKTGTHTTPDAITIQQLAAEFVHEKIQALCIEASSHGLAQGRLNHLHVQTAIFTNLTRDHLDYHHTIENYALTKELLFQFPDLQVAVINVDDDFGAKLWQRYHLQYKCYAYTLSEKIAKQYPSEFCLWVDHITPSLAGLQAQLHTPWGDAQLQTNLLGRFNLSNLLGVIGALSNKNYPLGQVVEYLCEPPAVPGRLQRIAQFKEPLVVIDYAHTPDALTQVLTTLRAHCMGQLWCVFGCGGDRDRGKRPEMGTVASRLSDHIVVTSDNPRSEEPTQIIQEILTGMPKEAAQYVIADRKEAIYYAIEQAAKDDVILIAGKGHETYQEIQGQRFPFNDLLVAHDALKKVYLEKMG